MIQFFNLFRWISFRWTNLKTSSSEILDFFLLNNTFLAEIFRLLGQDARKPRVISRFADTRRLNRKLIPHDKYDVRGIAYARTNRKDNIFMQRWLYIDKAHMALDIFRFAVFFLMLS